MDRGRRVVTVRRCVIRVALNGIPAYESPTQFRPFPRQRGRAVAFAVKAWVKVAPSG